MRFADFVSFIAQGIVVASASDSTAECDPYGTKNGANCLETPVVKTSNGPVVGYRRNLKTIAAPVFHDVSTFRGMPFAASTEGQNRFRAPQPVNYTWTEVAKAIAFQKSCPQAMPSGYGTHSISPQLAGEDCLYLNVYTPTEAIGSTNLKPVMVFLAGGGYFQGDGANYIDAEGRTLYDGAPLVSRHGAVIVTLNYRLSGLGFFAHDALRSEDPDASTGNMGVLDQRAALKWVQANIAGFGGNKDQVTLFGESAGAFSIMWHLVSPQSWPLFHGAILESGTSKLDWFFQPYEHYSKDFYVEWAKRLNCSSSGSEFLDCLRKRPMWDFVDPPANLPRASPLYDRHANPATASMSYGPTIDGSDVGLRGAPVDLMRAGKFHKVPIIIGANLDEGTLFGPLVTALPPKMVAQGKKTITSLDDVKIVLAWALGEENVDTIISAYPESQFKGWFKTDYQEMMSRMIRDVGFDCSNRAVVESFAAAGVPSFLYKFAWNPWLNQKAKETGYGPGVTHAFELPFVWRAPSMLAMLHKYLLTDPTAMSNIVSCTWANFVFSSNPNGVSTGTLPSGCDGVEFPEWPQYSNKSRQYISLKEQTEIHALSANNVYPNDEFASDARCDMWDKLLQEVPGTPWPVPHPNNNPPSEESTAKFV